jgi:hypothetical protein
MLIQEFAGPNGQKVNQGGLPIPKGGAAMSVQHPGALPIVVSTSPPPGHNVGRRRGVPYEKWPWVNTNNAPYSATTLEGTSLGRRSLGQFAQDTADKIVEKLPSKEEVLPRVQQLLIDMHANMAKIRMAERTATLAGIGGGIIGIGIGAGVGKWASADNRIVTTAASVVGAAALGLLTFGLTRRVLMPPLGLKGFAAAAAEAAEGAAIEATGAAAAKAQANGQTTPATFASFR